MRAEGAGGMGMSPRRRLSGAASKCECLQYPFQRRKLHMTLLKIQGKRLESVGRTILLICPL